MEYLCVPKIKIKNKKNFEKGQAIVADLRKGEGGIYINPPGYA